MAASVVSCGPVLSTKTQGRCWSEAASLRGVGAGLSVVPSRGNQIKGLTRVVGCGRFEQQRSARKKRTGEECGRRSVRRACSSKGVEEQISSTSSDYTVWDRIVATDVSLYSQPEAESFTRSQEFDTSQRHAWRGSSTFGNEALADFQPQDSGTLEKPTSRETESESTDEKVDRLLESLLRYDVGQTAEDYRIRAVIFGKIAEYVKGHGSPASDEPTSYSAVDKEMAIAMQHLAGLVLSEEGRSAADYNCRAQFFEKSAEVFEFNGGRSSRSGSSQGRDRKTERILEQLEEIILGESGRSISDYNRRANVFEKTAIVLSARKRGAAASSSQ